MSLNSTRCTIGIKRAFCHPRENFGHGVCAVFKIILIDKFHYVNPKGSKFVTKKNIDKIDIEDDIDQVQKINDKHFYCPCVVRVFTVQKVFC